MPHKNEAEVIKALSQIRTQLEGCMTDLEKIYEAADSEDEDEIAQQHSNISCIEEAMNELDNIEPLE
jgi:hypothetical protein